MKFFDVTHILVATDLSDSSVPALQYARAFADHFAAKVTVLYSDPVTFPMDAFALGGPVFIRPDAQVRDEVTRYAAPVMEGRPYDIEVTAGPPIPAILRAAADLHADLIVVATHVQQILTHTILGSVSEGVLHGSRCPVLTIADRGPVAPAHSVTKIICPVNFSDVARDSVRAAARTAEVFGAQLVVVHVVEPDVLADAAADEEKVRRWIDPELQDSCSYRQLVLRGGPAERVLDCVEDVGADFLVIGAQQKFFRDATVIGTTTERLTRFALCPVLVIPRQPVALRETAPQKERETTTRRY